MLQLPLKLTEPISLVDPIRKYCNSTYGKQYYENISSIVSDAESTRNHFSQVGAEVTYVALQKYLFQIHCISSRFPIGNYKGGIKISFKWTDSWKKQIKMISGGIAFEKACVAYNIAALMANSIARNTDDTPSEEDFKSAVDTLRMAAGIFTFIEERLIHKITDGQGCSDLSVVSLKGLANSLLAKVTEMMYVKAYCSSSSTQLLSKLAKQASVTFFKARANILLADKSTTHPILHTLRVFGTSYEALAYYHRAIYEKPAVEEADNGYAALVVNLRMAESKLKEAELQNQELQRLNLRTLNLDSAKSNILLMLKVFEEQNSVVHKEKVPKDQSLLYELECVRPATCINVKHEDIWAFSISCMDAFAAFIPPHVQGILTAQRTMAVNKVANLDHSIALLQSKWEECNASKSKRNILDEAWSQITEFRSLNPTGYQEIKNLPKSVNELAKYSYECSDMMQALQITMTRVTNKNSKSYKHVSKQLSYLGSTLGAAESARSKVMESYNQNSPYLRYFTDNKLEFEGLFHGNGGASNPLAGGPVEDALNKLLKSYFELRVVSTYDYEGSDLEDYLGMDHDLYNKMTERAKSRTAALDGLDKQISAVSVAIDESSQSLDHGEAVAIEVTIKDAFIGMEDLKTTQRYVRQGFEYFKKMKDLLLSLKEEADRW